MSYKDGSAKQTKDHCNRFNHLDAPLLSVRVLANPGFGSASSGPENGFVWRRWAVVGYPRPPRFVPWPVPIPDPQAAAEIVAQRLIDAGFAITAQRRAQPWGTGADHTGSGFGRGWRATPDGWGDNQEQARRAYRRASPLRAEHDRQLGGESPLSSLMAAKD
jgi:hypothetical protein